MRRYNETRTQTHVGSSSREVRRRAGRRAHLDDREQVFAVLASELLSEVEPVLTNCVEAAGARTENRLGCGLACAEYRVQACVPKATCRCQVVILNCGPNAGKKNVKAK